MNQEFVQAAASHSVRAVMRYLGTRLTGLSAEEVETRRSKFGVISHADFEPSAAVHRVIRQHLGLPLDGPLTLSFADQARFAAEAIRRIHALGRYANVFYGAS